MRQNNYWSDRYKRQFKNQRMRLAVEDQHAGGQGYCRLGKSGSRKVGGSLPKNSAPKQLRAGRKALKIT